MLGVAISAPTLAGIMGGCQASSGHLGTLSSKQHELLGVMTEHIIPTTDTPGAQSAGVADYIDAMLTDFYSEENRTDFLDGLEATDNQAEEKYGKAFMSCTDEEQFALLNEMDAAAFPDLDGMSEDELAAYREEQQAQSRPFIRRLKELTIAGYYTSEVGATQELHLNPMGSHQGDIPYSEVGRAWA